jgi:hypothetical protein
MPKIDVDAIVHRAIHALRAIHGSESPAPRADAAVRDAQRKVGSLPPALRAFYLSAGDGDELAAPLFGFVPPSELAMQEAQIAPLDPRRPPERIRLVVVRRAGSGHEYGAVLGERDPFGRLVERSRKIPRWRFVRQPLAQFLVERAAWDVALKMPFVFTASLKNALASRLTEFFAPLAVTLSSNAYCEEKVGIVAVRLHRLAESWTLGAREPAAEAAIRRALRVPLVAVRSAPHVPRASPAGSSKRAKPGGSATPPTRAQFDRAIGQILQAAHGERIEPGATSSWLAKAERRVGRALPWALASFHAFARSAPELLGANRRLVAPASLTLRDGVLWIAVEAQRVVKWGVRREDLGEDPPVWQFDPGKPSGGEYASHLSAFLLQTAAWQSVMAAPWQAQLELHTDREVSLALTSIQRALPRVGARGLTTPTEQCFADPRREIVAILVRGAPRTIAYFGGSHEKLKVLERAMKRRFDWL